MTATDDNYSGPAATRHDGWTMPRQLAFLEALADTGSVTRAAAAVGMSPSSAYRLRGRRDGDVFGYGWQAGQAMAYYRLRDIALDRIDFGVATPSVHRGEVVAIKTVFSDRLLVAMLDHLKPAAGTVAPTGQRRPADDPGRDFAATIEAYATAIDGDCEPSLPESLPSGCVNGCKPPKIMSRAEFMAAIRMPKPGSAADYDPDTGWSDCDGVSAEDRASENDVSGVNFA